MERKEIEFSDYGTLIVDVCRHRRVFFTTLPPLRYKQPAHKHDARAAVSLPTFQHYYRAFIRLSSEKHQNIGLTVC